MAVGPAMLLMMLIVLGQSSIRMSLTGAAKHDTVVICHVPADPDETMEIPENALNGHLRHGDYVGSCQSSSSQAASSQISSVQSSAAESSVESSVESSSSVSSASEGNGGNPGGGLGESSTAPDTHENQTDHVENTYRGGAPRESPFGVYKGRGLGEHATVIHRVLEIYDLHENAPYDFTYHHENIRPASFASEEELTSWTLREHAACCSIFRYLQRLREIRPNVRPGYVDWMSKQVATALDEDVVEIKAALLGMPHAHPHTSAFVQSITEAGCSAKPLTAAGSDDHAVQPSVSPLTIADASTEQEIVFAVIDSEDTVFTSYGVSHTKEMHLLIVRDDLRHFHHVHPERDAEGAWHVPFVAPAGGTYRIYADFVDQKGTNHTLRFERTYAGDPGPHGVAKHPGNTRQLGRFLVTLAVEPYPQGMLFTYRLQDAQGNAPFFESYLGAMGHGVLIAANGDFIHTHPSPASDTLIFHIPTPTEDFYRVFTQMKIDGEVQTVEFDWEP